MRACAFSILCMAGLSCTEEREIPTFRVATSAEAEKAGEAEERSAPRPLRWLPPETWEEEKPGEFQAALYRIAPGITASVSKFPGDGGGVAANVNRWRDQVGLEPVAAPTGRTIPFEESGSQATWFEIKGAERSILAAIIPLDGETWFFKLDSPTVALETARPGFMDLLKSIEVGTYEGVKMPKLHLQPPAGWEKREGDPLRFASYRIPAAEAGGIDGDVSVIPVPGDAGTNLHHINLWRAQLRLPPLEKEDDPGLGDTTETSEGKITLTHMASDAPFFGGNRHAAISAAILRTGEVTWFFKMAGEADMVSSQRAKFVDFVRTARVP